MSHDVFLSYHHSDKASADRICEALESNGIRGWIAPRDVLPGKEWAESIVDAIESAKAFVIVFSARSNDSAQVKREVERAVHIGIPIIPIRIEPVEPNKTMSYFLGLVHRLDAFTPSLEPHLPALVEHAQSLLDTLRAAEKPPPPNGATQTGRRLLQDLLDQLTLLAPMVKASGPQSDAAALLVRTQLLSVLPNMTPEEKGIALRALHLAGIVQHAGARVDLSGVDFSGADLSGALLPEIHLYNTNLRGADLRGANVANGTLQWADITDVKFDGARLDGVVIVGNEIEDAGLDPAFLLSLGANVRRPD